MSPFSILPKVPLPGVNVIYAAVIVLGPPSWDRDVDFLSLTKLLTPRGGLIFHAGNTQSAAQLTARLSSFWGIGHITSLTELDMRQAGPSEYEAQILLACSQPPGLNSDEWYQCLQLSSGAFHPDVPNLEFAQRTRVIHVANFLGDHEIETIHKVADHSQRNPGNIELRSAPHSDAWKVSFLQANGLFDSGAHELKEKITKLARAVGDEERWWADRAPAVFNVRVAEYHWQEAPGPGLPDPHHYDMDSLVTVDILLSTPGSDFEGGQLMTFEADGSLKVHTFGRGDAVVFCSHKFHCVTPVVSGCRRVLVVEFWRGPTRSCPHRCRSLQPSCPEEPVSMPVQETRPSTRPPISLPFRWGSAEEVERVPGEMRRIRLLWQINDMADGIPQQPTRESSTG